MAMGLGSWRTKTKVVTDDWEEKAEKVLSNFNYTSPDEIDIYDICWRYGIKILPLDSPFIGDSIDYQSIQHLKAFSIPSDVGRRGTIFIKECLNSIEKKLLIAEEFCHIYSQYSSQLSADTYMIAKAEKQVKKMTAYLLMPKSFMEGIYDAALDEAVLISDIADYFVVTDEFAQYRLKLIFDRNINALYALRGKLGTLEWYE